MNSLQKQFEPKATSSHEDYVFSFETNLLKIQNLNEVELIYKKLQFLGLNFDPFQSEVGTECEEIMNQLHLAEHMRNPYLATNILLRLLDKTEERLNNLKQ
jgi:hypothetical protein